MLFEWDKVDKYSYLRRIEALKGVDKIEFIKPVSLFVGENGTGKSTLLEAIAIAHGFNPEGGTKNYSFSTHDTHSELCDAIRVSRGYRKEKWGYFLRAESFYNVTTHSPILLGIPNAEIFSFDEGSIHTCSYEETDRYRITEMFINNRERLLNGLLAE